MRRNTTGLIALIALMVAGLFFVACSSSDADSDGDADTVAAADADHADADHADADHEDADADHDEDMDMAGDALFDEDAHETIVVDMQDISFGPADLTIEVGELVEIELKNSGALDHDFTIEEIHAAHAYHMPDMEAAGHDEHGSEFAMHHALVGGDSITMRMVAEEAGTYEFYCTVPGHREAGMVGTLTVTD